MAIKLINKTLCIAFPGAGLQGQGPCFAEFHVMTWKTFKILIFPGSLWAWEPQIKPPLHGTFTFKQWGRWLSTPSSLSYTAKRLLRRRGSFVPGVQACHHHGSLFKGLTLTSAQSSFIPVKCTQNFIGDTPSDFEGVVKHSTQGKLPQKTTESLRFPHTVIQDLAVQSLTQRLCQMLAATGFIQRCMA